MRKRKAINTLAFVLSPTAYWLQTMVAGCDFDQTDKAAWHGYLGLRRYFALSTMSDSDCRIGFSWIIVSGRHISDPWQFNRIIGSQQAPTKLLLVRPNKLVGVKQHYLGCIRSINYRRQTFVDDGLLNMPTSFIDCPCQPTGKF